MCVSMRIAVCVRIPVCVRMYSMCAYGLNIKSSLVRAPWLAKSRSQCSDSMRDSVSLFAVMTSPSSSFSLSSACRSGYVGGCDGGIMQRGSGMDATRDGQGYITVSTSIRIAFNCIFRQFRVIRLLSWALRRVLKRKGREENMLKWNKSAYKISR